MKNVSARSAAPTANGIKNTPGSLTAKNQTPSNSSPTVTRSTPTQSQDGDFKEITFKLNAISANEVLLAGNFTGWQKDAIKLRRDGDSWQASLKLPPGLYHYRFIVDGAWQDDPSAAKCPNSYGTCDSVLTIP